MPTPRAYITANVVNGKIYSIGGDANTTINEVYDPTTDMWTTATPIPNGSWEYTSAAVDGKIYIINSARNQGYDSEAGAWSQALHSPSSICEGAAASTTGANALKRIYVFGKTLNLGEAEPKNTVRVYNPKIDKWVFGADLPTPRFSFHRRPKRLDLCSRQLHH